MGRGLRRDGGEERVQDGAAGRDEPEDPQWRGTWEIGGRRVRTEVEESVLMVGPSRASRGGIATVVGLWEDAGVFQRWGVRYIASHEEGGRAHKISVAARALGRVAWSIGSGRSQCLHVHVARRRSFWRKALFVGVARLLGCPVVLHLHSGGFWDFVARECNGVGRWAVRRTVGAAARVVVLTESWRRAAEDLAGGGKIVVIPNFVPTGIGATGPRAAEAGCPYFLFLGKMGREKGVFELLEAFARVGRTYAGVRLKLGGDGDAEAVERSASALGVGDSVDLLGWVTGESKPQLIGDAVAFVLPSHYEGLPMGVLEAMEIGCPVIATPVGGVPDIVRDGVDGLLVPAGDVSALAEVMTRLLSDQGLRGRLSEAGKARVVEQFSREAVMPKIDALYRDLGLAEQR